MRALARLALWGLAAWLWSTPGAAQRLLVGPYLQDADAEQVWVHWQTRGGRESRVEWGESPALGRVALGRSQRLRRLHRLHEVRLAPLAPDTRYYYRVRSGRALSGTFAFRTPPRAGSPRPLRFVAVSDMQRDRSRPDKFREVVRQGIVRFVRSEYKREPAEALSAVLVPGDIVHDGRRYRSYRQQFFGPIAELARQVPIFPAIGNHEHDSAYYFRYFRLPARGDERAPEHWWWRDLGNVRVIGLDSNEGYRSAEQLRWLERVLADACRREGIDFVVGQLHHPERSELWPAGDTPYAGLIARRFEAFGSRCDKPTLQLHGHTHGYARVHSREHRHTTLGVASAGGHLDHVEGDSVVLPEAALSQAEYGFVVIEVEAGVAPSMRLRRISLGDERHRHTRESDRVLIRRHNRAPHTPEPRSPRGEQVAQRALALELSGYADPEGDPHAATQVQLSRASCDFRAPWRDTYLQRSVPRERDVFSRRRERAPFGELAPDTQYCYRVRVRDEGLAWSDWSEPVRFRTRP